MTEVFNHLKSEGHNITRDHMAAFSPYHTEHLGRLGSFELDLAKQVKPMTFELDQLQVRSCETYPFVMLLTSSRSAPRVAS